MQFFRKFIGRWVLPPAFAEKIRLIKWNKRGLVKHSKDERALLRQNEIIKNKHKGQRCFILGAGPSIKQQDLKKLQGEYVISVSNTFVHPDFSIFKPQYHVLPHILKGHSRFYDEATFVAWLREMENKTFNAEMFFHLGDRDLIERNGLFKSRIIHWNEYCPWDGLCPEDINLARIPSIWSVSEIAISVAIFLGFEKIYLIGFDHDWFNGPLHYFYDHKTEHALKPDERQLDYVDSEFQMRRHADIFKKYKCLQKIHGKIINVNPNPNHYLDVFERADYSSLFEGDS